MFIRTNSRKFHHFLTSKCSNNVINFLRFEMSLNKKIFVINMRKSIINHLMIIVISFDISLMIWISSIIIVWNCKKQESRTTEGLRPELRQATRSPKLERPRREPVSTILQLDQRYTQQTETSSRSLPGSYDWVDKICLRRKLQNVVSSVAISKSIYYISSYTSLMPIIH